MTDLFTHWIDVVHWAMKSDQPRDAQMLADKYVFDQWECPDTIQAAFRYPGFDVVYEGMMNSSIDGGGLEFRGTEATLKIDRGGFAVYRESVQDGQNPVLTERSFRDGTITHMENFFECVKSRKEPNAPVETGVAAARAGHIGNLAFRRGGQTTWPPEGGSGLVDRYLLTFAQFANPDITVAHRVAMVLQAKRKFVRRLLVGRAHMVAGGAG